MNNAALEVFKAALDWYIADERRREAARAKRKAAELWGFAPLFSPERYALDRADQVLAAARKSEQQARRALKKACAKTKPLVIDIEVGTDPTATPLLEVTP